MQPDYEQHYHQVEANHWWFRARRQLVRNLVLQANPDRNCRVLDIGCSSGLLLQDLIQVGYTCVRGVDASDAAIARCRRSGLEAQVMDAQKPAFGDNTFDVLTASDVLEHLEQDAGAVCEWERIMKPGGWLIVFVPAFMSLWTAHDLVNRHFRRYRKHQLVQLLGRADLRVERASYWNTTLFPPVALLRLWRRAIAGGAKTNPASASDMFLPPVLVNRALMSLLSIENKLVSWGVNFPFGISVMAAARKPVRPVGAAS